jgi:hypothetical protein
MKYCFVLFLFCYCYILKAQTFNNVAPAKGIHESYDVISDFGGGVSFFDFDNDGWDDLTFVRPNNSLKFYRNDIGNFTSIPSNIYISGRVKQALWVDYNNDNLNDLCVSVENGPCKLFKNTGNLNLVDVTIASGIPYNNGSNYSVSFSDYNKDGFLDLLIGRYSYSSDSTNMNEKNALYKNNGNGTFTDVTIASGIDIGLTQTFEAIWLDYNKDGWPDIYTATDRYNYDNALFRNNGNGTFTDVAQASGAAAVNVNAMTNTIGDFDNDADLDIYLTNIGYGDNCKLLVNNNNGTFTESGSIYGVDNTKYTWGASWIDADNDAYLDLMVVSDSANVDPRNNLYMNNAGSSFVDSPQNFQSNSSANSRSIAYGDINNDGKIDVVVGNTSGYDSFLWQNTSVANNYIKITLHGTVSNKMAIGSWISVYAGGHGYYHYTMCGENYMGQNSQHHIFGLAQNTIVDSVVIQYLSGIKDRYYNLNVNQSYDFTESGSAINYISYSGNLSFCEGDSVILDAGTFNNYLWSNGAATRYLIATATGVYSVIVTDSIGNILNSDSINVFVAHQPEISFNTTPISCFNSQDGTISLAIVNETNIFNVNWNQGQSGTYLGLLYPGKYIYNYIDTFGCKAKDSIYLYAPYPINIQTQVTPYSLSGYGAIVCIINGGTPPYNLYINGSVSTTIIDSLLGGNYSLQIIDDYGCIFNQNIFVEDLTVTHLNAYEMDQRISPNPTYDGHLQLNLNFYFSKIEMYDLIGKKIKFTMQNNELIIDESYKGLVNIMIQTEKDNSFYKIIKL